MHVKKADLTWIDGKTVMDVYKKERKVAMELKKSLMTVDEFCEYIGIGKTKAREMLSNPCCKYVVRIGRRVFVHKELLDEELKKAAKYQLKM